MPLWDFASWFYCLQYSSSLRCSWRPASALPLFSGSVGRDAGENLFTFISSARWAPRTAADGRRLPDTHRVSNIGRFMRRTRLDELPQLINIIRGDMSFVGPRPLLPQDQPKASAARLLVRPGLTGWAQIVGGRDIPPEDKAALDLWYVRNASLLLDLRIFARTIPIILFGERISQSLIERARRKGSSWG